MTITSTACPSCEFTHGTSGKAVAGSDGLMRCQTCGSTWREIGSPARQRHAAQPSKALSAQSERARIVEGVHGNKLRPRLLAGDGVLWLAGVLAAFSLVAQPFWLMGQWDRLAFEWPGARQESIEISMLSARQLEREGRISVKVEGRIVNRSDKRQPVGEVDITLSQEQGHPVYKWKHRPAVPFLEPGQSIRFSTANGEVPSVASSVEVRSAGSLSVARL